MKILSLFGFFWLQISSLAYAQVQTKQDSVFITANYKKQEFSIPMRDGIKLFTVVYSPKDELNDYPIMMIRTPYSVAPYGTEKLRVPIGPNMAFAKEGFVFVYQDVRGKYKSEGVFAANRPYTAFKNNTTDETTDTYDTIDWLIKHVKSNQKVGIWGVSSPGFYASMSLLDSHPNLKAVSPQAPVTDWFLGDDRHHNGAFMLMGSFSFLSSFGKVRDSISTQHPAGFSAYNTSDSYDFYLKTGALKHFNKKYLQHKSLLWNEMMDNPEYNSYWEARSYLRFIKDYKPAVLLVGGWFDQEDLYGPLKTFERLSKSTDSKLHFVMGPWYHGSWTRGDGDSLGIIDFGQKTALFFREEIELPFFVKHLKGKTTLDLAPVKVFFTGANEWEDFKQWPPEETKPKSLFLRENKGLSFTKPMNTTSVDSYLSDPSKPVPYTAEKTVFRGYKYMFEDQSFAAKRPDVLVYETEVLADDLKIAGNIVANLYLSSTGTDADFIVKLIDVYPYEAQGKMSDYQLPVRAEVMRSKFRESFRQPKPLVPGEITQVSFDMQDAAHVFKKGHKIMVQVQSSWFPLVDRNPQRFLNIYKADDADFEKHQHSIYSSEKYSSNILLPIIE